MDGPSAGVAMALVAISALSGRPVDGSSAVTGEIGVQGKVRPVGGVPAKVEAAKRAGLTRVLIPRENYLERFEEMGIRVIPVDSLEQAMHLMLLPAEIREEQHENTGISQATLAAAASRNGV